MGLPQTGPEVVVDGRWLTSVAPGWGDLKITDRWTPNNGGGGGPWEATWTVPVNRLRRHQALLARKRVRIFVGGWCRWSGYMSEPDWDTGEMVALGSVRKAAEAICFDSTGQTTSVPDVAIDQAIARGAVDWTRRASFSAVAYTGTGTGATDRLNYLGQLLDADATRQNVGWGVTARDEVYTAAAPTTPTMLVAPDSGVLGNADDTLAATLFGRYTSSTTGRYETTSVGAGTPEVGVDLTDQGRKTQAEAAVILTGMRDQLQARPGWTNSLILTAPQITSPGGCRTPLALVRADGRQMARLQGVRDERGLDSGTNFAVGETVWDVADRTVQVAPVGMIGRDLGSIIENAGGVLLS